MKQAEYELRGWSSSHVLRAWSETAGYALLLSEATSSIVTIKKPDVYAMDAWLISKETPSEDGSDVIGSYLGPEKNGIRDTLLSLYEARTEYGQFAHVCMRAIATQIVFNTERWIGCARSDSLPVRRWFRFRDELGREAMERGWGPRWHGNVRDVWPDLGMEVSRILEAIGPSDPRDDALVLDLFVRAMVYRAKIFVRTWPDRQERSGP